MKILMYCLILSLSSCLAIPLSTTPQPAEIDVVASAASGESNRVEGADALKAGNESISLAPEFNNTTHQTPSITHDIGSFNATKSQESGITTHQNLPASTKIPRIDLGARILPSYQDELFKVRVLDLNHPTKPEDARRSEISIGLPVYHQQGPHHVIKVPELYVVKVPHYVVVKESDFLSNLHHVAPSITGPFYPFQEIPSLTQDFSSSDAMFGILESGYPIYPIDSPQEILGQYPISGGVGDISVIPADIGQIPHGLEIIQPVDHVGFSDEKIDHETDSITVDALESTRSTFSKFKLATKKNEGDGEVHKDSNDVDDKRKSKEKET